MIRSNWSSLTASDDGIADLTLYLGGRSASLSELLPMLQSMGVVVLEERPFTVTRPDGLPVWIYQFKISPHQSIPTRLAGPERDATATRFADAVTAIWHGRVEIDRFNELVLRAGLTWQQVAVLRSYAKYLRQAGFPYSQSHIETVINDNAKTARSLVELFEALFDPADSDDDAERHDAQSAAAAVAADIDALVSLDTDRVLRAFASMIQATLRTNYFVTRHGFGARAERVVVQAQPRSDRRTAVAAAEVRDLRVLAAGGGRAPAVRPRGARRAALVGPPGGLPHRDPRPGQGAGGEERRHRAGRRQGRLRRQEAAAATGEPAADRDAQRTRAWPATAVHRRAARPHRQRRQGDRRVVIPAGRGAPRRRRRVPRGGRRQGHRDVLRHRQRGRRVYSFWLGDAFASGGSVGYDHKAMGITAKGAWEAVKRHFREMGVDTQTEDFTVVGVGDMSGDVFGNGMLLSKHIRLLAAFDHRHIFIDPNPDAATSWDERKRLFDLPRSSWEDYDRVADQRGRRRLQPATEVHPDQPAGPRRAGHRRTTSRK